MKVTQKLSVLAVLACMISCNGKEPADTPARLPSGTSGSITLDHSAPATIPGNRADTSGPLTRAISAARLSDGSIAIADGYGGHEQSIKAYGSAGQLLWTAGRHGGGPGEFQNLGWLAQCGPDSLFVWDGGRGRLEVFDSGGHLAREGQLPGPPLPVNLACSRSGTFVMMTSPDRMPPSTPGMPRLFSRLIVANSRGDSLWGLPDLYLGQNRPLGTTTRLALSTNRLYVGTGDSAWVDEYDLQGHRMASFRVGGALRPATMHQYDRALDQVLGTMAGTPADRAMMKKMMLARTPMPEYLPPYTALLTSPGGSLWVVTTVPGDDSTVIRAYSPTGDSLGTLQLPADTRVFEIGEDYVLGARTDSTGQEIVAEYHYRRE